VKRPLLLAGLCLALFPPAARPDEPRRAGPDWWSLQPVKRLRPPAVKDTARARNPIDAFILAKLQAAGLRPAPEANRSTLIRRATLDLTGLPPTPAEIDAFVNDPAPDAYERLIDRLLASPRYGERWGRHWLDVVRFGESQGFERDKPRDHAWPYRDYVIQSLNADKPYDRFIREQIAGDVLAPVTAEGIVATGFLVCGPWDEVGQTQQGAVSRRRVREEELEDMIAAVGQTFLGLTLNCARCHAHKFDPIPQRDYYRVKAALEGVRPADRRLPGGGTAYAVNPAKPEATFVLRRGDVENPGEEVSAGALSAVKALKADFGLAADAPEGERRRKLADWLASADNPLTARVMVNRLWQHHFGRGLVASPSDFGFSGDRPSHPELLDWLADEFVRCGWSVKHLHRLIMLSATYRQSARPNPEAAAVDADNRLLWRFAPRRLEAEAVRDAMLCVSGQLNPKMGGPSYRPFTVKVFNSTFYDLLDEATPEMQRRTVYRMSVNSAKNPLLDTLDCPDPSVKAPRRAVTTTPLQALGLMNSSFVLRQARHFAGRVEKEAGDDPAARVALAYRLALGRSPTAAEKERAVGHVREHGVESLCWVLLNASEFLYVP
jgi:hypothetical protein